MTAGVAMSFFRALQDSAFTDWFLGSDSIWAYPTVLTLHTVGMAMLVGASIVVHLRVWQVGAAIPIDAVPSALSNHLGRLHD